MVRSGTLALTLLALIVPGCSEPTDPGALQHPDFEVGDWWTYHLVHHRTGLEVEFTHVVAAATPGHYLIGFPSDGFSDAVMIAHFPGTGEIRRPDLGFEAHDIMVTWLPFPLRTGDEWATAIYWNGAEMMARVVSADATKARVEIEGSRPVTIDVSPRGVERVHIEGYVTYQLLAAGQDYRGDVVVPMGVDLVLLEPLTGPTTPEVGGVLVKQVADYEALSGVMLLYDGVGPTDIDAKTTAPDGTTWDGTKGALDRDRWHLFHHASSAGVAGRWNMEATIVGSGLALLEAVAYHPVTYRLDAQGSAPLISKA